MRQRGFTLLEMMLILLLIGVSAGMVMLAFPASRDDSAAQALARFEAQLRFVQQRGLQTGQFFGASVHPDRWQFLVLQPRESNDPPPGRRRLERLSLAPPARRTRRHLGQHRREHAASHFSAGRGLDAGRQSRCADLSRR